MNGVQTQRLLRQVATRRQLIIQGRQFYFSLIGLAAVYALLLAASRLLALIPNWLTPLTVLAVPGAALLIALIPRRKASAADAARAIDAKTGGQDLFLTVATIDGSPAEFQAVVIGQAEEKAAVASPRKIVSFPWQRKTRDIVLVIAALLACAWYLPQLDPFGRFAQQQRTAQRKALLQESMKATAVRAATMDKKDARDEQVKSAIAELEKAFNQAKPAQKEANLKRLEENQKQLGQLWRELSDEKLKEALNPNALNQGFGAAAIDPQKIQQWKDELKKGETTGLQKEFEEIKSEAQKLAAMPDSPEKQKAREDLQNKLQNLADALSKNMSSPQLNAALARAMDQLQMSQNKELSADALQAMQDSMNLSEKELTQLAQSTQDLQSLEDSLKNIQMAKKLNDDGKLDGNAAGACKNLGDYAALYAQMLAGQPQGVVGPGGGQNPALGQGGDVQYDDTSKTDFKPEQSNSALSAGKLLMQWSTKEVSASGTEAQDYDHALKQVRQSLSEAIIQEQVPPAYHEAIKKYFDSITPPLAGQKNE